MDRRGELPDRIASPPLLADARAVERYAALTKDFNPIHLDEAYAANTPFGIPIAHGTLSLALLLEAFARELPADWRVDATDIRWTAPLPVGATIVAHGVRTGDGYDVHVASDEGVRTLEGTLTVTRAGTP